MKSTLKAIQRPAAKKKRKNRVRVTTACDRKEVIIMITVITIHSTYNLQ